MSKTRLIGGLILVVAFVGVAVTSLFFGNGLCTLSQTATCGAWWVTHIKLSIWGNYGIVHWAWTALPSQSSLGWFDTNLGSGALFFALDGLLVIIAVPLVLNFRARRNWAKTAGNVAHDILILGDQSREDWEYALGYADEITSAASVMGNSMHAFPALEGALYDVMSLILRIRRRLVYLTTTTRTDLTEAAIVRQEEMLKSEANELVRRVEHHRAGLEKIAARYDRYRTRR